MSQPNLQKYIAQATNDEIWEEVLPALEQLQPQDVAGIIAELFPQRQMDLIQRLSRIRAAKAINYLIPEIQYRILHHLPAADAAPLLHQMSSDSVTDMLLAIHPLQAETLLNLLPDDYREKIHDLMTYPSNTAGGRATVDYVSARTSWTCEQTIRHIRKVGMEAETISYVYVTSAHGELYGVVSLKEVILTDPTTHLEIICNRDVICVQATAKQEAAATTFSHYSFYALPVVDPKDRLVGILTYDDIADVLSQEATEDFQKLGGSRPLQQPYLQTSVWTLVRSRLPWLLVLFVSGSYTSSVLENFRHVLDQHMVLSFFIALLTGTGGNTGSQIINTVVRALSVGDIGFRHIGRVVFKECMSGLALGSCLGMVAYGLTFFFLRYQSVSVGEPAIPYIISLAALSIVVWSSLVSALLPLVIHRLRLDPAVISGPLISTLVDGTGLFIYFEIAKGILSLSGSSTG